MGHWDEHLALQSFINEAVVNSKNEQINSEIITFFLGVAQHELYDLVVNEKPINLKRIDFKRMDILKTELPSIYLNVVGIGLALWKCFIKYDKEQDKRKLRIRLAGLLGAVTPDILEGLRLLVIPDGKTSWMKGDASYFHLKSKNGKFLIDSYNDGIKDINRRTILQELVLFINLLEIKF